MERYVLVWVSGLRMSQERKEEIIIKIISACTCVRVAVIIMLQGVAGGISSFSMPWRDLHFNGKSGQENEGVAAFFNFLASYFLFSWRSWCVSVLMGLVSGQIDIPPSFLMPYECG